MDELENGSTDNQIQGEDEPQESSLKEKQAKAYQQLQSEKDRLASELQKEREEKIRYETRLQERERLQGEQRETVPEKPKAPIKPKGFSLVEASTDENSPSARYMLEKMEYDEAKEVYDNWRESQFERERQSRLQAEQQTAVKRDMIAEFSKYVSQDEAVELANIVIKGDYEKFATTYKAGKSQPIKDKQTEQIPLPPGVVPNHTGKTEKTHAQKMREFIAQKKI